MMCNYHTCCLCKWNFGTIRLWLQTVRPHKYFKWSLCSSINGEQRQILKFLTALLLVLGILNE